MYCTPVAIESISQRIGDRTRSLPVPKTSCTRAMSQKTADTVTTLLKGVVEDGTGQQAGLSDRPSAGKTGTTDNRYAAWFVGFTPNLAGAVWVGDPTHKRQMKQITIGGVYHDLVYGADTPGPIWKDAMTGALGGKPVENFNLVDIPDGNKGKGNDDGHNGDNGGNANGGLIGGLTTGGTDGGANGGTNGGTFPTPTFSFPDNLFQGTSNGNGNGNGNGGRRG
jgi:membrane peptidoglycan carboxypeptidase